MAIALIGVLWFSEKLTPGRLPIVLAVVGVAMINLGAAPEAAAPVGSVGLEQQSN